MIRHRNEIVFESKKVIKTFTVGDIKVERAIYQQLKDSPIRTAELLDWTDDTLVLSVVNGMTMNQLFEQHEQSNQDFLNYLIQWEHYLNLWHQWVKVYRYGDVNMNNFIYNQNEWVGIDFEQAVEGSIYEDIADMICFILFHSPKLSDYKYDLVAQWMEVSLLHKSIHTDVWKTYLLEALKRLNQRRNKEYKMDIDRIMGGNV